MTDLELAFKPRWAADLERTDLARFRRQPKLVHLFATSQIRGRPLSVLLPVPKRCPEDRGQFAVGVNNITDFLRPLVRGRVKVVAEPIHQGATQQLWQVTISRADDGKLLARGQVRLQNVPLPEA
ncbi:MAG: PaaI family thioesterase [Chloroflexi bacterium]|nr:MAG: PaaI family thioesterase [Chloroflexota bacterium]